MKSGISLAALVLVLSVSTLFSADFWDEKPYTDWRHKDCEKLLADSPWAHPYALTGVNIPGMMDFGRGRVASGRSYGDSEVDTGIGDREVHLYLQIRFLTARPLKAAIGQMRLLADKENKALKDQVEQYVNQEDGPEIIVEITTHSEPEGHFDLRQIDGFLRTTTLPAIQNKVWLSDSSSGTRVPILRYQPPQDGYSGTLLFFSRYDEDGNPCFNGTEHEILFHMEAGFGLIDLILKPGDMVFNEEFTF